MPPKVEAATRPMQGVAPHMIAIATAQELRAALGEIRVGERTCSEWIDRSLGAIERDFFHPELNALLEVASPDGSLIDHIDGRTLNPGHAMEGAWFILHEAKLPRPGRTPPAAGAGDPRLHVGPGLGSGIRRLVLFSGS